MVSQSLPNQYLADPDVQLMLRVVGDDHEAFEELVTRYQDRLIGFFYHLLGDRTVSEDLEGATSGQEEHTSSVETLLASDNKRPEQQKQQQRAKKQQQKNKKANSGEKEATFYASPVVRTAFMAVFTIAKRQSRRKGFAML